MGRGMGAGERVHVRLQLQASAELRLPPFPRGNAALQGREGAADEEAEDACGGECRFGASCARSRHKEKLHCHDARGLWLSV